MMIMFKLVIVECLMMTMMMLLVTLAAIMGQLMFFVRKSTFVCVCVRVCVCVCESGWILSVRVCV